MSQGSRHYSNSLLIPSSPSRNHTLLSYEWRSSWGLLYNIFPDKLLNLGKNLQSLLVKKQANSLFSGLISEEIFQMQSQWYPQVSQVFGVPLDNRHSYTKSDWQLWTAAYCEPSTRRLFVDAVAYWLNYTSTNLPFTDLYETIDDGSYPVSPSQITFIARPVVGGHFSLLSLLKTGDNSLTGTSLNSTFPANSTSALSESGAAGSVYATDMPLATVQSFSMASMDHLSASVVTATFTSIATVFTTTSELVDSPARYTGVPPAKQ